MEHPLVKFYYFDISLIAKKWFYPNKNLLGDLPLAEFELARGSIKVVFFFQIEVSVFMLTRIWNVPHPASILYKSTARYRFI